LDGPAIEGLISKEFKETEKAAALPQESPEEQGMPIMQR